MKNKVLLNTTSQKVELNENELVRMKPDFLTNAIHIWEFDNSPAPYTDNGNGDDGLYHVTGVNTTQTSGILDECLAYNGTSSVALPKLNGTGGLLHMSLANHTINTWVKQSNTLSRTAIHAYYANPDLDALRITPHSTWLHIHIDPKDCGSFGFDVEEDVLTSKDWNMITLVMRGFEAEIITHLYCDLYINGEYYGTSSGSVTGPDPSFDYYSFTFGTYPDPDPQDYFGGYIDQTAIWNNRNLTSIEISALYNEGRGVPYSEW